MAESLKSKTITALFWSFIESVGLQAVRFAVGIILARLLFPEQFGLIGMLIIFIAVAQSFLDSGFGAALIQKKTAHHIDLCSVFYFNIGLGITSAGILGLMAPGIAGFYNQSILTPIMRALSVILIIDSLSLVQVTLLSKSLNFKTLTKVNLFSGGISGAAGITLAMFGFGVWSLVAQQICASLLRTGLLWLLSSWRPTMVFSLRSLRNMFPFGSKMFVSGVLNQIFANIYLLAIGKIFSAADLGYFTRAKTFAELPSHTLAGMVGRVTFPIFSTIQDDPERLKRGLKKGLCTLVMLNFAMMIGLMVIARPLVLTLVTERWAESIIYLQLLCLVGLLYPLHVINLNLLQALGKSNLFLRLEVIKKILVIVNIAVTYRWGISAIILGMMVTSGIAYYLNSYYTGILISYSIREQLWDLLPYLIIAAVMGGIIYAVGFIAFPNNWSLLLTQIFLGIVVYFGLCRLFRLSAFMDVWQMGWNKMTLFKPAMDE